MKLRIRKGRTGWCWTCPHCAGAEIGFAGWPLALESALDHLSYGCLDRTLAALFRGALR